MEYLFERFKLTDKHEIDEVARVILAFRPSGLDFGDSSPLQLEINPDAPDDYVLGLSLLEKNNVITYEKSRRRLPWSYFHIEIVNMYNLELLLRELVVLQMQPDMLIVQRAAVIPKMPSVAYYELSTGTIMINGKLKTLPNTNKKLFDALFIAHPGYADRNELLKIVGVTKRDRSSKVVLNEAFTNLRKVCRVSASTISLNDLGGKLKAHAYPLPARLSQIKK